MMGVCSGPWALRRKYIYERSSSTKLKLNKSTKRNAWLSLRDTSPWRATNSEECDVVRRSRYLCFLARLTSLHHKPWYAIIEQVIPHGLRWVPLNHQKQWRNRRRNEAHKMLSCHDLWSQNQTLHNCAVSSINSKNKLCEFICDQEILILYC